LKGRLAGELPPGAASARSQPAASDVMHALLALGYSDKEASHAVKQLPEGLSVSDGIRQALRVLAKA
jgi:Holliday junction DNA helicase RuvA